MINLKQINLDHLLTFPNNPVSFARIMNRWDGQERGPREILILSSA